MNRITTLKNPIQNYAWGSRTFIALLLGKPVPSESPQAELWMGAHPKAPSEVCRDGKWVSVLTLIQEDPEGILGRPAVGKFGDRFPFLFKVLAAAKPLSIQAHPNREQAMEGFDRENREQVPFNAPYRNYKDNNHKPEILCALNPFWAMKGFRNIEDILLLMNKIDPLPECLRLDILRDHPDGEGLRRFLWALLTLDKGIQRRLIAEVLRCAERYTDAEPAFRWLTRLHLEYPGDVGVLAPLFLNLVHLAPGEALYIRSGEPHTYLEGAGLEVMANSDNVLRGGLTPKHIDLPELFKVLNFVPTGIDILRPEKKGECECHYPSPPEEFALSMVSLHDGSVFKSPLIRGPEVLICTDGVARIADLGTGEVIVQRKGTVTLVPASVRQYSLEGNGTIYKASVLLTARLPEGSQSVRCP